MAVLTMSASSRTHMVYESLAATPGAPRTRAHAQLASHGAGANIGACTFHVLAAVPHAHVLAAEPMAYNLWYLTRTVLAQPAERAADWRRRLRVLPLALGARKTEELAYVQAGNAGNTVLGTATEASWDNPQRVRVERLDDVLPPGTRIALLKADVQGYEMELLRGAERLLRERAVQAVQLEVATVFLNDHGTRPSELCAHLSTRGFSLFRTDGRPLGANECVSWDAVRWNSVDVVGVLQ
jgi:FkbM family methyltransferase